jgi:nitrogen fixation protein FixH
MNAISARKPIDKYIPWMVVVFFLIFIAVDAVMVTLAVRTQTGIVTEQAYEKGLAYNQALDAAEAQKSWGWMSVISLQADTLSFSLKDKNFQIIQGAEVTAIIRRPVQDGYDVSYSLTETINGDYQTQVNFPMPGEWDVKVSAKWQNKHYQAHQTFIVH